jgi:hypothetical protein
LNPGLAVLRPIAKLIISKAIFLPIALAEAIHKALLLLSFVEISEGSFGFDDHIVDALNLG